MYYVNWGNVFFKKINKLDLIINRIAEEELSFIRLIIHPYNFNAYYLYNL